MEFSPRRAPTGCASQYRHTIATALVRAVGHGHHRRQFEAAVAELTPARPIPLDMPISRRHSLTRDEIVAAVLDYRSGVGRAGVGVASQLRRRRRRQQHDAHISSDAPVCDLRMHWSAADAHTNAHTDQRRHQNAYAHANASMLADNVRVGLYTEYQQCILPNRAYSSYVAAIQRARRFCRSQL